MARVVQIARYQADGTQVTREFDKMGQAGERMGQRVRQGAQSMSPALRGIDAAAGAAHGKVQQLAGSAGTLGRVLTAMGPAGLAAAAAIGGLTLGFTALQRATRQAVDDLSTLYGVAQSRGVSTDALQELRFAVIGVGGAIADADRALLDFNERIGEARLTRQGAAFMALTRDLGFTPEDIANLEAGGDSLNRIAEAIANMNDAQKQTRVARELGLEPLLPLLQQGAGAFEEAARAAHEMGYVLDRELLSRASQFSGQWAQAAAVIDVQFKSALVDLAPVFIDLARNIAGAARELRGLVDLFKEAGDISRRSAEQRLRGLGMSANQLIDRFGMSVTEGGDASRALDPRSIEALVFGGPRNLQQARDYYARLVQEADELRARIAGIDAGGAGGGAGSGGNSIVAAINAQTTALQQFVEQLEAEAAARGRVAELMGENAKLSREEAQAAVALEADLRRLEEARAAGVITSDAELERLEELRRARDAEAQAIQRQQAELQRLRQIEAANDRLRQQIETPQQRIQREIASLEKNADLNPELVAERIRQLREEYRELAAAQYEASLQGRILAGVIQGQIRDFDDLQRVLVAMAADAFLRELMAGGVMGERGFTGFISRSLGRMGVDTDIFGDLFAPLQQAAQKTAVELAEGLAGSAAEAAAELVIGKSAKAVETLMVEQSTTAFAAATAAAYELAAAMAAAAAADKAGGLVKVVSAAAGVKGGGKAGGGALSPYVRHPGAEMGTELLLFGGWGQVAPNEAVQGLAALARLARAAQSAPAQNVQGAAPRIGVNIINQLGADADASVEERFGADGETIIDVTLTRKFAGDIAAGKLDGPMRRYGSRPPVVRRG
jgi:hypothetical protein